ncbi:MAG: DUF1330 domain-containing protein [Actinomycetia bacterium]|nr:DUF1330 domain-containing protein [Actinomycetes bacterium]MCP3909401.1 DUF1330 domain-containing protein [Actinomycetes bacterium]MCP4087661.1 DUF1330 domain-containing protein [Actinomycetes bacterium]
MTAYVIARVDVTDPDQYEQYKKLTPAAVGASGGRFIVRGGATETLEGAEETRRIVMIEFPDMDAARAFYDSPAYREARAVRAGAADMHMLAVEGA